MSKSVACLLASVCRTVLPVLLGLFRSSTTIGLLNALHQLSKLLLGERVVAPRPGKADADHVVEVIVGFHGRMVRVPRVAWVLATRLCGGRP